MTSTHNIIAFQGEVELEKAVWDTDWGMYAVFRLDQKPQDKNNANPFKKFTKMRKGKVGTRFDTVFTLPDDVIAYEDEVMLKGWSDGTTGWKVTFWMKGHEGTVMEHPFMDYEKGKLFSLVLVELDEDETPIDQVKRERLSRSEARKQHPLAMLAGQLAKSEAFQEYLGARTGHEFGPESSADWIRTVCNVESRKELDTNKEAASRFHAHVRTPFLLWQGEKT